MPHYEYKVVPAPTKGQKAKGIRGPEARFAHAVQELMNAMAEHGWEYQRAETLPSTERAGLTGSTTEWRNMLVFRRLRAVQERPELLPAPSDIAEDEKTVQIPIDKTASEGDRQSADNGVEDTQSARAIGPSLSILARARSLAQGKSDDALIDPIPKKDE